MNETERRAEELIDDAHRQDPRSDGDKAYEVRYAERLQAWVNQLVGEPSAALRLAARAQHLERWAIPRDSYPQGRSGYLRWRAAVHRRQGERAHDLLREAGCDAVLAARVAALVAKTVPREDPESQALEDAACLVFLETELEDFMKEYPREKTLDVIRKTWRKMSPGGQKAAATISISPEAADAVREATS